MSGCSACAAAVGNPLSARYQLGCLPCLIRAISTGQDVIAKLAKSPEYAASEAAGRFTPAYKALLIELFGADGWQAGHQRVKEARLRLARNSMEARS